MRRGPHERERRPGQGAAQISTDLSSTSDHTLRSPRLQFLAERLHKLGPRALHEFIIELATAHGASVVDRLEVYAALDPEILRAIGGHKFPPRLWWAA